MVFLTRILAIGRPFEDKIGTKNSWRQSERLTTLHVKFWKVTQPSFSWDYCLNSFPNDSVSTSISFRYNFFTCCYINLEYKKSKVLHASIQSACIYIKGNGLKYAQKIEYIYVHIHYFSYLFKVHGITFIHYETQIGRSHIIR